MDREKFIEMWNSLRNASKQLPIGLSTWTKGRLYPSADLYTPKQNKEELYTLVNKVEKIKPKRIMEVGFEFGGTLKFWEQLAPPDGLIIGIDVNSRLKDCIVWDWKNSDRDIRLIVKDSMSQEALDEVKNILGDNKLDFLFIDGNHTLPYVQHDFQTYGQLVREGGLIAFHDVTNSAPGVQQVFNSLKGEKELIQKAWVGPWAESPCGIGVWIKRQNIGS